MSQHELAAAHEAAAAARQQAEEAEARGKAAEAAAVAATTAAAHSERPGSATAAAPPVAIRPNSPAAVSAAVAAALGGSGGGGSGAEPALDDLLSPGGTTLRFTGPTVGYAEAAAASPPQAQGQQEQGRGSRAASASPRGGVAPSTRPPHSLSNQHSRGDSISSEIEPAEEEPLGPVAGEPGTAAAVARRPPSGRASGAASPRDLAVLQARMERLERELADSERTHTLRDRATAVLKEEIAELRWVKWVGGWVGL